MDKSGSLSVVAVDEDGVGGRVGGLEGEEAASEGIEMEEGEREGVLKAIQKSGDEMGLIEWLGEEEALLDVVYR